MTESREIAILVDDGYEDREFWYPKTRLEEAGFDVKVVAHEERTYSSKHGYPATPDLEAREVDASDFEGVVIPGGVACPDQLRRHREILDFVRRIDEEGKLVAAICHAAWVPISAGIVEGREMTCYYSIKDDVKNAGASYKDREVVVDGNLVTSRHPGDLPAFIQAILGKLERVELAEIAE